MSNARKLGAMALAGWILSFGLAGAQPPVETELTYLGVKACKMCHNKADEGQQYTVWKSMAHSRAYEALKSEAALAIAKERNLPDAPSVTADCVKCHVTGYDPARKVTPRPLTLVDSVQCESCHGAGSEHMAYGKFLRMNKGKETDLPVGIVKPDVNTCVQCHNSESASWDPGRYTLESGETVGFDYAQAFARIAHMNPKKATD